MDIDIYARHRGQTHDDLHDQDRYYATAEGGRYGYLREACDGEPYVTRFLCREAFETGQAAIPAAVLRERLPEALRLVERRERELYGDASADRVRRVRDNYTAFVEHCEFIEWKTGEPIVVVAHY